MSGIPLVPRPLFRSSLLTESLELACVASVSVRFKRKENSARVLERFIFCALPIFRAAKTRALADLDRFLGFPFAKNATQASLEQAEFS